MSLRSDNSGAELVSANGLTPVDVLGEVLRAFLDLQRRIGLHAFVEHIPGYRNDLADELSRLKGALPSLHSADSMHPPRCIFCCAHPGDSAVLLRPNGLGRGREGELFYARSCYEGTCSGLSPSGRSELLSGAAPPCLSLFDLLPMASNAFHLGLHVFDASAFASLRTSYRLLGWVTFVHHSVKVHVRQLHASGYDSPEYFIFYIPLNIFGFGHIAWPILHLFTFEFNESSRAPAHGPGPNGVCKPTLVFGLSPAGVLEN